MKSIQAIYQDGVFKPLAEVQLPENQRVTVVVTAPDSRTARGVPADQVRGIAAGHGTPPDDATVGQWIDERRLQRAAP